MFKLQSEDSKGSNTSQSVDFSALERAIVKCRHSKESLESPSTSPGAVRSYLSTNESDLDVEFNTNHEISQQYDGHKVKPVPPTQTGSLSRGPIVQDPFLKKDLKRSDDVKSALRASIQQQKQQLFTKKTSQQLGPTVQQKAQSQTQQFRKIESQSQSEAYLPEHTSCAKLKNDVIQRHISDDHESNSKVKQNSKFSCNNTNYRTPSDLESNDNIQDQKLLFSPPNKFYQWDLKVSGPSTASKKQVQDINQNSNVPGSDNLSTISNSMKSIKSQISTSQRSIKSSSSPKSQSQSQSKRSSKQLPNAEQYLLKQLQNELASEMPITVSDNDSQTDSFNRVSDSAPKFPTNQLGDSDQINVISPGSPDQQYQVNNNNQHWNWSSNTNDRYRRLYQDAQERKKRQQQRESLTELIRAELEMKECTFEPQISQTQTQSLNGNPNNSDSQYQKVNNSDYMSNTIPNTNYIPEGAQLLFDPPTRSHHGELDQEYSQQIQKHLRWQANRDKKLEDIRQSNEEKEMAELRKNKPQISKRSQVLLHLMPYQSPVRHHKEHAIEYWSKRRGSQYLNEEEIKNKKQQSSYQTQSQIDDLNYLNLSHDVESLNEKRHTRTSNNSKITKVQDDPLIQRLSVPKYQYEPVVKSDESEKVRESNKRLGPICPKKFEDLYKEKLGRLRSESPEKEKKNNSGIVQKQQQQTRSSKTQSKVNQQNISRTTQQLSPKNEIHKLYESEKGSPQLNGEQVQIGPVEELLKSDLLQNNLSESVKIEKVTNQISADNYDPVTVINDSEQSHVANLDRNSKDSNFLRFRQGTGQLVQGSLTSAVADSDNSKSKELMTVANLSQKMDDVLRKMKSTLSDSKKTRTSNLSNFKLKQQSDSKQTQTVNQVESDEFQSPLQPQHEPVTTLNIYSESPGDDRFLNASNDDQLNADLNHNDLNEPVENDIIGAGYESINDDGQAVDIVVALDDHAQYQRSKKSSDQDGSSQLLQCDRQQLENQTDQTGPKFQSDQLQMLQQSLSKTQSDQKQSSPPRSRSEIAKQQHINRCFTSPERKRISNYKYEDSMLHYRSQADTFGEESNPADRKRQTREAHAASGQGISRIRQQVTVSMAGKYNINKRDLSANSDNINVNSLNDDQNKNLQQGFLKTDAVNNTVKQDQVNQVNNRRSVQEQQSHVNRLIQEQKQKQDRLKAELEVKIAKQIESELSECTFKPKFVTQNYKSQSANSVTKASTTKEHSEVDASNLHSLDIKDTESEIMNKSNCTMSKNDKSVVSKDVTETSNNHADNDNTHNYTQTQNQSKSHAKKNFSSTTNEKLRESWKDAYLARKAIVKDHSAKKAKVKGQQQHYVTENLSKYSDSQYCPNQLDNISVRDIQNVLSSNSSCSLSYQDSQSQTQESGQISESESIKLQVTNSNLDQIQLSFTQSLKMIDDDPRVSGIPNIITTPKLGNELNEGAGPTDQASTVTVAPKGGPFKFFQEGLPGPPKPQLTTPRSIGIHKAVKGFPAGQKFKNLESERMLRKISQLNNIGNTKSDLNESLSDSDHQNHWKVFHEVVKQKR